MMRGVRWSVAAVVLVVVAAACGGGETEGGPELSCAPGETDGDLVLANWSEYVDPALLEAFEAETGVAVVEEFYSGNEDLAEAIAAGTEFDLAVPSEYFVGSLIEDGALRPIDRDAVPNLVNLAEDFRAVPGDPDGAYAVAYQWGTTGLAVDRAVVGADVAPSWAILFEEGVLPPQARAVMLDDPRESLGAALRYLGYSLNTTDEDEIRQAGELIEASRSRITSFDSDSGEDLLLAGEVAAIHAYSGDVAAAAAGTEDPDRYEYFIPQEGGVRWVDAMVVPAGAEHPCSAHAFMDFVLDPERGAQLSEWNSYASPNAAATELIDPALLEDPAVYPPPEIEQRLEFITDLGPTTDLYSRTFALARD